MHRLGTNRESFLEILQMTPDCSDNTQRHSSHRKWFSRIAGHVTYQKCQLADPSSLLRRLSRAQAENALTSGHIPKPKHAQRQLVVWEPLGTSGNLWETKFVP